MLSATQYVPPHGSLWHRFWAIQLTPWTPGHVWRFSLGIAAIIGSVSFVVASLVPWFAGWMLLWAVLPPAGFGLGSFLMYRVISSRIRPIRARVIAATPVLWADALVGANQRQAPGIVEYRDGKLRLHFFSGRCEEVTLSEMLDVHESRWFWGEYLGTCRCFRITAPGPRQLGFAVANAEPWRELLTLADR